MTDPRQQENTAHPSHPIPARTERRTNTTNVEDSPDAPRTAPENLDGPEARLPHERDQATSMTGGIRSPDVEQAYKDVTRGLKDTDKGPPMDRAYQKQKE